MTDDIKKQDLYNSIRLVLLEHWDPVGVRSFIAQDYEAIKDEYDIYITDIMDMIYSSSSIQEIEEFLLRAEKEEVPGIVASNRSLKAAKLIFSLRDKDRG